MKSKQLTILVTILCAVLPAFILLFQGCGQAEKYRILDTPVAITDNLGNKREYRLFMPAAGTANEKVPLIVYFHGVWSECFKKNPALKGYTGSPVEETGLIQICKLNKIALLVPKAHYEYMFLNCPSKGWSPFDKEIDGIEKIIDAVVEKYPVSKKEIYLAGISAGAVVSHHLANRRPTFYNAVLSHSQGYITEDNQFLQPAEKGPRFGVLICYTRGDYKDLLPICTGSEKIYRDNGYRTALMENLAPKNHSWAKESNARFLRTLKRLGQYTSSSTPSSASSESGEKNK
jgi:hypothetical protein